MMDQGTKEGIERFKAAADRIRSGESVSEEVELSSGRVRLTADESTSNGIRIEVLGSNPAGGTGFRPDPPSKEAMERIKDVIGRFRAGELDSAEIPLPTGGNVQLTRDDRSPGGFTMRSPEGGPTMRCIPFEPSSTRPEEYPEDLPFLAEAAVALTEIEGQSFRTLTWFKLQDPEECLQILRLQLVADGWEAGTESNVTKVSMAFGTMVSMEFQKGEKRRAVILSRFGEHSTIKLLEHTNKGTEAEG